MPDQNDEDYYRRRAASARGLAEAAVNPAIKAIHERMAVDYDALASNRRDVAVDGVE